MSDLCLICKLKRHTNKVYRLCTACFQGYVDYLPCHECKIRDVEEMIETETEEGIIEKYHQKCWEVRALKYLQGVIVEDELHRCVDCKRLLTPVLKEDVCRRCYRFDIRVLQASTMPLDER